MASDSRTQRLVGRAPSRPGRAGLCQSLPPQKAPAGSRGSGYLAPAAACVHCMQAKPDRTAGGTKGRSGALDYSTCWKSAGVCEPSWARSNGLASAEDGDRGWHSGAISGDSSRSSAPHADMIRRLHRRGAATEGLCWWPCRGGPQECGSRSQCRAVERRIRWSLSHLQIVC